MKKSLFCILMMLLPILASADPVEVEGVWYNLIPKAQIAEVTSNPSGDKYTGDVTILDKFTYDGVEYSVTKIMAEAFRSCYDLTSVTIPNSVESIGIYAFDYCNGLTSVHISDIKAWCGIDFYDYSSNPLYYANHLYLNGEEIKDLVIPNSVTSISNEAFSGCSGLTSVTIPNSVTSIGDWAFGYSGLTSVTIPNSVTFIGEYAFCMCSDLTSVTIGNSVKSIGKYTFYDCSSLTSVTIGNSVKSIDHFAFDKCSSLTSVHISDIKAWCEINFYSYPLAYAHHLYMNGEEIKDLIIPNSVTSIGGGAFSECTSLTSVTIGNSVTSIGGGAFSECTSLTSVTIGNSVTTIGDGAFRECSGLTSVTIPNSVESIGNEAFGNCELLSDVYCMAEQVRENKSYGSQGLYTHPDAFADSYQEYITLHVPAASVEAYRAIEPWKYFKEVVALNGEDIPDIPATPKCATPIISLVDGKITFSCETEGVEYISNVSVSDAKDYYDNEISVPKKFKVTVYATKASYDNSDTATAEFDFSSDTSLSGDVDGNGIVNVADHVKLSDIIMKK